VFVWQLGMAFSRSLFQKLKDQSGQNAKMVLIASSTCTYTEN
jgi:hypothetical protein